MSANTSRLDHLYRRLLLTKFFTRGWGKPDNLKRLFAFRKILSNRETCQHLVASDYPINIDKEYKDGDCRILEGHFLSPFVQHLPGIMPKEVETATFQVVLPSKWKYSAIKPICIHLAGTGDHYFWRRRILTARPLLKEAGIASIILENPYYGTRKPKEQIRSSLHNVSDLFVMGGALVLESMALLHWCERNGWGPLGLSGVSMGGHMASGAATLWPKPISVVPILSWTTASIIFTQGVMSGAIPWTTLQEQIFENSIYQDEIRKLIISPEENRKKAYDMGQQFVKDYSQDIEDVETLHKRHEQQEVKLADMGGLAYHPPDSAANTSGTSQHKAETASLAHKDQLLSSSDLVLESLSDKNQSATSTSEEPFASHQLSVEEYLHNVEMDNTENTSPDSSADKSQQLRSDSPKLENLSQDSPVELSPLSRPSKPTTSAEAKSSKQKKLKRDAQSLTLSYAKTKQSQQSKLAVSTASSSSSSLSSSLPPPTREPSTLSLRHALAKSRLIISRKPQSSLPTNEEQLKTLQHEALDFMRGVMDECTHLGNFSVPVDPELIIIVAAKQDAYIPRDGVMGLDHLWPGCEVRYVDNGHVSAVLFNQSAFRKAIIDSFDRQIQKHYSNKQVGANNWVKSLS